MKTEKSEKNLINCKSCALQQNQTKKTLNTIENRETQLRIARGQLDRARESEQERERGERNRETLLLNLPIKV